MKKALLLALALIAVGCADARQSALCEGLSEGSPLEDVLPCAEQGYANAQSALGWMYANGQGVPEDDAEAAHWYRLAAEQGNVRAQNDLTQRDWPRPAQEPILDEAGMARCAAVQQFAHGLPHLSQ